MIAYRYCFSVKEAGIALFPVQFELPTSHVPVAFPTDAVHRFRDADPSPVQDGFAAVVARQHQTSRQRQVEGRGNRLQVPTSTITRLKARSDGLTAIFVPRVKPNENIDYWPCICYGREYVMSGTRLPVPEKKC